MMTHCFKDQGRTDTGATPLLVAAQNYHNGHLEVVRFLVVSGANKQPVANKDQGLTDAGETRLLVAAYNGPP